MSHIANDIYSETLLERFDDLKEDGLARVSLLREVYDKGLSDKVQPLIERWWQEKMLWLEENGINEADILTDDMGREYYMDYEEYDGQSDFRKKYLPDYIDITYWINNNLNYDNNKKDNQKKSEENKS